MSCALHQQWIQLRIELFYSRRPLLLRFQESLQNLHSLPYEDADVRPVMELEDRLLSWVHTHFDEYRPHVQFLLPCDPLPEYDRWSFLSTSTPFTELHNAFVAFRNKMMLFVCMMEHQTVLERKLLNEVYQLRRNVLCAVNAFPQEHPRKQFDLWRSGVDPSNHQLCHVVQLIEQAYVSVEPLPTTIIRKRNYDSLV